ncbi:hypothetical protein DUT91_23330 [Phyllobacterium salinisoli]|uniref:Asparagine synthetase domain-containing protein n=2 Tax=Phyllobacterium salinisoli TaxID=1899321 RepID=A0A368JZF8_9HYPH|nr:hypothetical protein DUT91_23330 [Phyllobacterium salinisoli]
MDELLCCSDPANSLFRNTLEFDGTAIILSESNGIVRFDLLRTLYASAPLYISSVNTGVVISWDFLHCAAQTPFELNLDACRRFIVYGPTLETATILRGVKMVGGGQHASWSNRQIEIADLSSIPAYEENTLSTKAEAALCFLDMVAEVIRPRLEKSTTACLELSGGLDSACVAAALGRGQLNSDRLMTYGLIHAGIVGSQQIARRSELIQLFNFADITVPSSTCHPFEAFLNADGSARHVPNDELFRQGIEACIDQLPKLPDLILTGIGGDELTIFADKKIALSRSDDDIKFACEALFGVPLSSVSESASFTSSSAVASSFCRADMFLNRGIWPINPLTHPSIVQFSQILPTEMKRERALNKIALAKSGVSDYFLFPRYRENFSEIYNIELRHFDLGTYLQDGMIQKFGILKCPALIRQHILFVNMGTCALPLICFANAIRLEYILRTLRPSDCNHS